MVASLQFSLTSRRPYSFKCLSFSQQGVSADLKKKIDGWFLWTHFHLKGSGRLPSSPSRFAKPLCTHLWGNYPPLAYAVYRPRRLRQVVFSPSRSVRPLRTLHSAKPVVRAGRAAIEKVEDVPFFATAAFSSLRFQLGSVLSLTALHTFSFEG